MKERFEKEQHSFTESVRSYDTDNPYENFTRDTFYNDGDDRSYPPPVPSYKGDPPPTVFPVIDEENFLSEVGFDKSASDIDNQLPIGVTVSYTKAKKPSVEEITEMIPEDIMRVNIETDEINEYGFVSDSCSEGFQEDIISGDPLDSEIYVTVYDESYVPSPKKVVVDPEREKIATWWKYTNGYG